MKCIILGSLNLLEQGGTQNLNLKFNSIQSKQHLSLIVLCGSSVVLHLTKWKNKDNPKSSKINQGYLTKYN